MVSGKIVTTSSELNEVYRIWNEVFHYTKQSEVNEYSPIDQELVHVLVFEDPNDTISVAAGRLILNMDGEAIIDRIAVLKEYRRKYYGDFVLRMLLNKALTREYKRISLEASEYNKGFFEKIGFIANDNQEKQRESTSVTMIYSYDYLKKRCNSTYLR